MAEWFYLSFVDREPEGGRFLGGCYVQLQYAALDEERAREIADQHGRALSEKELQALRAKWQAERLGLAPFGVEVLAVGPLTPEQLSRVPEDDRHRLLDRGLLETEHE